MGVFAFRGWEMSCSKERRRRGLRASSGIGEASGAPEAATACCEENLSSGEGELRRRAAECGGKVGNRRERPAPQVPSRRGRIGRGEGDDADPAPQGKGGRPSPPLRVQARYPPSPRKSRPRAVSRDIGNCMGHGRCSSLRLECLNPDCEKLTVIQYDLSPVATFQRIPNATADEMLVEWGHYLGPCARPFGRESFALLAGREPVAVSVSASSVGVTAAGIPRMECVELARLCRHPEHPWATAACLRLWQSLAAPAWSYWPVRAAVSYCSLREHGPGGGKIYQLAGWKKGCVTKGSGAGGSWSRRRGGPKTVWVFDLETTCGTMPAHEPRCAQGSTHHGGFTDLAPGLVVVPGEGASAGDVGGGQAFAALGRGGGL